ncbi:hypothetical protein CTI12_AA337320 [Artemisia annua]|uniref:Uncharacterized protein n=1 Tax=Artemisia annua TaxID=35608 RepID=A0A2U1MVL2_ARTAN|nr:hypothetical protein CTI12_AA337320 [Artemisia annua]
MDNHLSSVNANHTSNGSVSVSDRRSIDNGDLNDAASRNVNRVVTAGISIGDIPYGSNGIVSHVANGNANRVANAGVSIGDTGYASNGIVPRIPNGNANRVANGNLSISDRLARAANSQDKGRQFYLFFERYRFILLNGQRDDRRHITHDRVLLQQLQVFLREIEGLPDSVLISRSLALFRALIAIVEQRIRAYARNVAEASRMASLVMDYLGDVMRM